VNLSRLNYQPSTPVHGDHTGQNSDRWQNDLSNVCRNWLRIAFDHGSCSFNNRSPPPIHVLSSFHVDGYFPYFLLTSGYLGSLSLCNHYHGYSSRYPAFLSTNHFGPTYLPHKGGYDGQILALCRIWPHDLGPHVDISTRDPTSLACSLECYQSIVPFQPLYHCSCHCDKRM
jgi:hypothetical protein